MALTTAAAAAGALDGAPEPAEAPSRKPVLVLRKVRQVLDAFTPEAPRLTARDVQRRTGLPATTCLRLLAALVEEGFLDRDTDRYRLGVSLLRWSRTAAEGLDLVALAAPVLRGLRDATGESACLFVRYDDAHVCVAVEPTPHTVIHVLRVGQSLPLHAGSAGRVFLAFDPAAPPVEQLARPRYTQHTITDPDRLREALDAVRREGYAATFEERSLGAASLSAPVLDAAGDLAAVLGIASPVQRFGPDLVPAHAREVTRAAAELSRRLGHVHPRGERPHD